MFTIDHYAISVKNMEQSVSFYEGLDFVVKNEWRADDGSISITHMKNDSFILELFCYRQYKSMPHTAFVLNEDLPVIGSKHIGLNVNNLEATQEYLLNKGMIKKKVEIRNGRMGRRYFFISDPDGILIEIIEKEEH